MRNPTPPPHRRLRYSVATSLKGVIAVAPVLLGTGMPLLLGEWGVHRLELVESRALGSGIVMVTYRPEGDTHSKQKGPAR